MNERIDEILEFWFGPAPDGSERATGKDLWFGRSAAVDSEIRKRFGQLVERAKRGDLDKWATDPRGCLALILLLDAFNRCAHRDTPEAFAAEPKALRICYDALDDRLDHKLRHVERCFFYLPTMHAEDTDAQLASVEVYQDLFDSAPPAERDICGEFLKNAHVHRDIVERFERFPQRNAILDRTSTQDESTFLQHSGTL